MPDLFGRVTQTLECRECGHQWTRKRPPMPRGNVQLARAFSVPPGNGCLKCAMEEQATGK